MKKHVLRKIALLANQLPAMSVKTPYGQETPVNHRRRMKRRFKKEGSAEVERYVVQFMPGFRIGDALTKPRLKPKKETIPKQT